MDAFAVSICKGLSMPRINYKHAGVIALFFGVFQAGMPVIGWALGSQFASFVSSFAPWIAFVLLAFIGGKMLWDARRSSNNNDQQASTSASTVQLDYKELFALAIATSIDALAVGVTFAFLDVAIAPSVLLIGVTTFCISFAGVVVGNKVGARFERGAGIAGGVVLILIGVKIVLEHYVG